MQRFLFTFSWPRASAQGYEQDAAMRLISSDFQLIGLSLTAMPEGVKSRK